MAALLPLLGGLFLARFMARRSLVIGVDVVLYALAAVTITTTAPDHSSTYGTGLLLSAALAPICGLTVLLGLQWRRRSTTTDVETI
jgi:hypothetical protein